MDIHRNVYMWGQQDQINKMKSAGASLTITRSMSGSRSASNLGGIRSYFRMVSEHKDIVRAVMALQGMMYMYKPDIEKLLQGYNRFAHLWAEDRVQQVQSFVDSNPLNVIIRDMLKKYESQTVTIVLKERVLNLMQFIKDRMKTMSKKIKDLDDVRVAMMCLELIRDEFIGMDMELDLIEESYATFSQFDIDIPKDDADMVYGLRYAFQNMLVTSQQVQQKIVDMQGPLQMELTDGVDTFLTDVLKFDADYDSFGPMTPGLSAREASDRVILFQSRFDELWRRFEMYSSGEKLFGMEVKDYPILHQKKKEFNLLSKLYSLYLAVMNSIDGYLETPWVEIEIEQIVAQLTEFDLRCRKLPRGMKDWPAFIDLKNKIDDFNQTCPLLELMADKSMKERHWKRLEDLMHCVLDVESPTFTLANVMEAPLLKYKEDVEDICIGAVKEKDIEAKLKQVVSDWAVVDLTFANFKNRGELLIKPQETLDIITMLEDTMMVLNSLASNRYNAPFKKDIMLWINKLISTSDILEKWLQVQNLWMYLEAVFVGGDIAKQLPAEAKRFATIDKTYVKIMYRARDIVNCVETCTSDDSLKQLLPHLYDQLEACQKSLTGYLETKRLIFPRFFFVSDPVLLEILGQASDPHSIQVHLPSIFDAIYTVDFDDKERIVAMNSSNGEKIKLERAVVCVGGVEIWLNTLLDTMKDTVRNIIANISQTMSGDPEFEFLVGFWNFPGQASLLGMQILWTSDAEYALKKARADRFIMRLTNQKFLDLLNGLIDQTVKDLIPLDRTMIETMITIHVHQRDIFDDLVKMRIKNVGDFEWQKQARFYYIEDTDDCIVGITDVDFLYQNEYLGITERLVITPLTDRCYITLSQAIGMSMGGAPAGPAGTGKTETTKDMGRALGKLVIVFNCSDQMDFRGLGRIYKGLAQSGTWGCFDEFNRIELPVLSVAAQQIYICLTARREKKDFFIFSDGDVVSLNPEFAFIITMNPGYAGRQELPENLKIQFRSVAMMVPDRQIIIRVKEMNVSKLVDEDEPLFISLIEDLFPGMKLTQTVQREMQRGITIVTERSGLVNHPEWNLKVIQLYETSLVRHGLMTMGPTGSGKTTCIHTLMDALTELGKPHREMRMNPKAITAPQMFGRLDVATNDWTDGIFSTLWRRALKVKKSDTTWIVLDGPVDAVWIENLNSVLDDNKTLTLANGDRITMAQNSKLVFEPDNVDNASPATVSRMGMVFLSSSVLKWQPILEASYKYGWLRKRPPREADVLRIAFNKVYDEVHTYVQQKLPAKMALLEAIYIRQCIDVLVGLLEIEVPGGKTHTDRHLERLFVFSLMWSLGAVLELDARTRMAEFMTKLPVRMDWPGSKSKEWVMPFEYMVTEAGVWQHWSESVEDYIYPSDTIPEYASILVPNIDNVCISFLIDTIAKQNKAVLLIGEQGTAKTVMLKSYMQKYDNEVKLFKMINFSSATTPNMFQRIIESYVEKRVGMTFGPPGGRRMTVFVDDINMPVVNEWGDQVTNEIVRQMMECGGFYSLEKPGEFIVIADIQMFGAMIHPGKNKQHLILFTTFDDKDWFVENFWKIAAHELPDVINDFPTEETYFVNFLREPVDPTGDEDEDFSTEAPKIYEELPSWEFVLKKLGQFQDQFNEQIRGAHLDLVFFHECMVHLFIISRIINTPRGNALLVGVGGSGKQSLTKLASFIANFKFYQITLTRSYNVNNFMDDIKILYRIAGLQGLGISFIFTDNDIKEEQFLEFLNNILSSGEIANLFPKEEMDEILNELTPIMKKYAPKRIPVPDVLYEYFIMRSRANLHVVLCFSPVGEKFRSRALKFPGLISGSTMDWFQKWPKEALIEVAQHFLSGFKAQETKTQLIEVMGMVQDDVASACVSYYDRFRRQTHVTPKSYLSFLEGYKVLYKDKHNNIAEMAKRMTTGLDKLVEAAASVDILKKELELKELEIKEATAKAEEVLAAVAESAAAAEVVKAEVLEVKDRAVKLVSVIAAETAVAEDKLAAAKPALDAAEAALQTINAADIATVRKLGKPPFLITLIMDAVIILFRKRIDPIKPDPDKQFLVASWAESLKVMADARFLNNLKNYPKDEINAEMVDLLQPYFNFSQYTFEAAKIACGNVAGLISWTIAMAQFYGVNKDVLPLKANLAVMQGKYQAAKKELEAAEALLQAKERELAGVQREFDQAMALKQAVLDDAAKCQQKMDAATALINGLSGERVRWTEQSTLFKAQIERLVGDILFLTGFLSYSGPFNQEYRNLLVSNWLSELLRRKVPVSMSLSITEELTDTATIGEWNLYGLPTDELSIQNGIIVTKASRFPLLIDPQTQGKIWIKNMERLNDLIVRLGDKEIDVTEGHKIYITTKLPNPAYTPEVSARTSIIDFTVTMQGLEDQLLGRVILTEKAELESERTHLIMDVTSNRRKMQELEANLLHKLTTIQGSLVEDVTLIQVLNVTKATATEVREKLDVAKETEIKINTAREEFRPVATRGSVLYFLICNMSLVCNMYQTSLAQFLERFDISMERSPPSPITIKRIWFIIDYLTFDVFKYICRGFYEKHKYLFTLLLTLKIDLQREYITFDEFQTFIKGGAALDLNACPPKPFKWLTDMSWLNLVQLSNLRQFTNILNQVNNNEKGWKTWECHDYNLHRFEKEAPEDEPLPDGYHTLDVFRKLLVVRAWCPDRTLAQSFSMGARFSEAVIVNYEHMVLESRPLVPLIGFLAMGSDPTPSIEMTAKRLECICQSVSMGQGQEVHARKLIDRGLKEGIWVLLQNCHLGLEYMVEIMEQFSELEKEPEKIHETFRLWITTEVHPKFPITLLQMSIKYTCEPPSGVKAGLMRTYDSMSQDFLDYSDSPFYLPLIYTISFLHTVVQERRKFGPLGWNIPYEFNSADWLASCMFVQNHLDALEVGQNISWTTVRYMVSAVQYGGRVTDDYDNRLLGTFCRVWLTDQLFTESFQFYKGYGIMAFKNIPEYLEEIEKMKTVDPPQTYGLHTNADITYQRNVTQELLDTILSIQPKESSSGGGETREASVYRQAKEMLEKVPPNFDPNEVKERLRFYGMLNSMVIFLRQEIDRMQKVITLVRSTLKDLLLAIDGTIIMNEALRDSLDNIYDAKVPNIWLRRSWSSSTLGFWFTEFLERNTQFSTWCFQARPFSFWMTGFFNPQGFLTAMRQEVTRAHKGWALDMVALHNDVTKYIYEEIKAPPPEGVYVHGVFLDGAGWDRRNSRLCESTLKVLYAALPVIHVYAINSTAPKDPKLYQCPVYKKPCRTDLTFITPLWLPTIKNPDHWILRGVAILCDIK
ncbi:Dynein heavy chain 8, axonemal [Papilio xuthus]|uniref:Dynein heavy chain 8, axonemal n=1 Tax=Papilio xuthus TaxID=66420 RepID=A0A194PQA3_PAPXU|nr:Dynein heavy chain 8, axonemal [Papilio xuthus]